MSREAKAAYVKSNRRGAPGESIAEIQRGLRKAEREIETDARARIRDLRKEAQLSWAS